jgi:zinc/manganese transport system permease protein
VSFAREQSRSGGLSVRAWDFLFYALFGFVVTSFVRIAGVLLVFSYLIVPAVCGVLLARTIGRRMLIGCIVALIGGSGGLFVSFKADLPTGAAIVCVLGALLIIVACAAPLLRRMNRTRDTAV